MPAFIKVAHRRELQCYFRLSAKMKCMLQLIAFYPGEQSDEVVLEFPDVVAHNNVLDIKLGRLTSNPRLKSPEKLAWCRYKCLSTTSGLYSVRIKHMRCFCYTDNYDCEFVINKDDGRYLNVDYLAHVFHYFVGSSSYQTTYQLCALLKEIEAFERYLFGTSLLLVKHGVSVAIYLIDFGAVNFEEQTEQPYVAFGIYTLLGILQEYAA